MITHYCFVGFTFLAVFLFLFVKQHACKRAQVAGVLMIVSVPYIFVYQFPIFEADTTAQACAFPVLISLYALFLFSLESENFVHFDKAIHGKMRFFCLISLLVMIQVIAWIIVFGFPWIKHTFSIDDAEAVLFTLQTSKQGAGGAVLYSFNENVVRPVLWVMSFLWIVVFLPIFISLKKELKDDCDIIGVKKHKYFNLVKGHVFLLFVAIVFAFLSIPILGDSVIDIYKVYTKEQNVVESELYKQYYVSPNSVKFRFSQKKNLIFIMLESMGTYHIQNLPELKKLQENNLSFLPGGKSIASQGWTIGSQIAKYCGIPLKFPVYDSVQVFLPNAVCMQDVLQKAGYKQLFVQGTDKKFASLEYFFETHSNIEMHDFTYFEKEGRAKNVNGSWGIDDFTLFDLMKEDILSIYNDGSPFAVYAMTMDTHWPSGFISGKCYEAGMQLKKKEKYQKALDCASKNIDDFIKWAKKQPWFENTVIVIQGDHVIPQQIRELLGLSEKETQYWFNVFINTESPENVNREFSAFDMFPTILEAVGADIEGHRLALGTSLLSTEKTLLEIMDNARLDSLINLKDKMDLYFIGE